MRVQFGRRAPATLEVALTRRKRLKAERRTYLLGLTALVAAGAVIAGELRRVYHRGGAEEVVESAGVIEAADETVRQTVEVARAGYQSGSRFENSLLNLMVSFSLTWAIARASTHAIRRRGKFGPFRNVTVGESHIHHFVPGILLAFIAGGAAILVRDERLDPVLAVPFGTGVALTLDESALLLKLDDVYWTEEGIVSVQITLAALLMLSALTLVLRLLRRGEDEVLGEDEGDRLFDPDALLSAP